MSPERRLLVVDAADGTLRDHRARELPELLRPGDVVVVNDAATLPASLRGASESGEPVEARLATELGNGRLARDDVERVPTAPRVHARGGPATPVRCSHCITRVAFASGRGLVSGPRVGLLPRRSSCEPS